MQPALRAAAVAMIATMLGAEARAQIAAPPASAAPTAGPPNGVPPTPGTFAGPPNDGATRDSAGPSNGAPPAPSRAAGPSNGAPPAPGRAAGPSNGAPPAPGRAAGPSNGAPPAPGRAAGPSNGAAAVAAGPPTVVWLTLPSLGGDARSGVGGAGDARDAAGLEPLRLGLLADATAPPPDLFSPCRDAESGAATGLVLPPLQRTVGLRLLGPPAGGAPTRTLAAPRLTLLGTSRAGCARDGAIGAGATLAFALGPRTSLVLSGGAIYLPQAIGGPRRETQVRADVVVHGEGDRSVRVGVSAVEGAPRLSFGGTW